MADHPPGHRQKFMRVANVVTANVRLALNPQTSANEAVFPDPNSEPSRAIYQSSNPNRPPPQPRPTSVQQSSVGSAFSSSSSHIYNPNQPFGQNGSYYHAQSSNNAWSQPQTGQGYNNLMPNQLPNYGNQSQSYIQPPPAAYGNHHALQQTYTPLAITPGPISASPPPISPPLANAQPSGRLGNPTGSVSGGYGNHWPHQNPPSGYLRHCHHGYEIFSYRSYCRSGCL